MGKAMIAIFGTIKSETLLAREMEIFRSKKMKLLREKIIKKKTKK